LVRKVDRTPKTVDTAAGISNAMLTFPLKDLQPFRNPNPMELTAQLDNGG
jgi:hypothetical protein